MLKLFVYKKFFTKSWKSAVVGGGCAGAGAAPQSSSMWDSNNCSILLNKSLKQQMNVTNTLFKRKTDIAKSRLLLLSLNDSRGSLNEDSIDVQDLLQRI